MSRGCLQVHRVLPGETLPIISQHFYGNEKYSLVIFQHNRDVIQDPNQVTPGMEIVIPYIRGAH